MNSAVLQKYFGFQSSSTPKKLGGYDSDNYLVTNADGKKFLFKKHLEKGIEEVLLAETEILNKLSQKSKLYSSCHPTLEGDFLAIDNGHIYRLVDYIEGDILANCQLTKELIQNLGAETAKLHNSLKDDNFTAISSRKRYWDLNHFYISRSYRSHVSEKPENRYLDYFIHQFDQKLLKELPLMPSGILHGDINDFNIIIHDKQLAGIIDLGDVTFAPYVLDIAICLTYLLFQREDYVNTCQVFVKEYNKVRKLTKEEISSLYYLIPLRCCQSILNAAFSVSIQPENKEYIEISQKNIWKLMKDWIEINPIAFENSLLKACGYEIQTTDLLKEQTRRNAILSGALSIQPIKMIGAAFEYMYSEDGTTYMDLRNNIPHVGHCHPKVVEAGQKQMAILNTNTRYYYDALHEYGEKLLTKFPDQLNKVFFVNSGSAASDLAFRIATTVTGKNKIMGLQEGYHGNTYKAIEVSHYKYAHKGGKGQSEDILKAPMPWNWKKLGMKDPSKELAEQAQSIIRENQSKIAGFVAEPIVGCGGQLDLPKNYLKEVYSGIRDQGGLCISDEVQTGFARLGHYWWGYQMYDVVPDIVITGKCIGNGHPMAAVITTEKIAEQFNNGMEFFSSFGGNPVSCEIGKAVLSVIEEEGLKSNAKEVGDYFIHQMNKLKQEFDCVGDIRGLGLFLGLEFVNNKAEYKANTELCQKMKTGLREKHILLGSDGPHDNVLKIKPPLSFSQKQVNYVIENMRDILKGFYN